MFEDDKDWKDLLSPEAQQLLAEMFDSAKRHKGAYMQSDDVKVAQLWCALVEIKKELDDVKCQLEKVSAPFEAIVTIGDAEKKRAIQRLISDIIKPTEEEAGEATKRLVESLMKF